MAPLHVGVILPNYGAALDAEQLASVAVAAEQTGFDSGWVTDHLIVPAEHAGTYGAIAEALVSLGFLAGRTQRLELGGAALVVPQRQPLVALKQLTTLDFLSGGRFLFGIGAGWNAEEMENHGTAYETRYRVMVERAKAIQAIWTQDEASFDGEFVRFEPSWSWPKPVQQPHPPLWFGAREPTALRRAVRLGNGWMGAGSSSNADFKAQAHTIRGLLDDARRDPATFTISKRVYIAVDTHKSRAEDHLRAWFGSRYRNADMASRVAVWGGVNECLDRLAELVASGAEHLLLNSAFDHLEHLEVLAQEIVPHLAGAVRA